MRIQSTGSIARTVFEHRSVTWSVVLALAVATVALVDQAKASTTSRFAVAAEKEARLIRVLKSNAAPGDKAIACKELAIYGTKDAVPALAPLLTDPDLASWARIALEAIPGSTPDAALRHAMDKLSSADASARRPFQARLLVGVINSIGVRKDAKAVSALGKKLADNDAEVASAAAIALGCIGGNNAAKLLRQALTRGPSAPLPAVADGCILCAEGFSAHGRQAQAIELYDAVRQAAVPKPKVLEATRGAIIARQAAGIALLLEQLHSPDKAFFAIGLSTARELPGLSVTEALADELARTSPERQPLVLLAIADRNDPSASAAVLRAARGGPTALRAVAIKVLERQGAVWSVPVLMELAVSPDAEVAQAAQGALTRFPGNSVDSEVIARLPLYTGQARQVLIEVASRRRVEPALPAIVACTGDTDASVRGAAIQAIGVLGGEPQAGTLIELLPHAQVATERAQIEAALIGIAGRAGSRCVPSVLPLAQNGDAATRIVALHVLASAGGPAALGAVTAAIDDGDESVRDEAVRTLSTWPNNWPDDSGVEAPMLRLCRYALKPSYQVLGLRGYLHYVEGNKQLGNEARVGKVRDILPLLKRPEEQRLAVGVVGAIPTAASLDLLAALVADPGVSEDACSAILKLAGDKASPIGKEQRLHALGAVVETAPQEATRNQARQMVKTIK